MTTAEIDKRLKALEKEVASLKKLVLDQAKQGDWRSTVGMFANDPVFDEIVRLGKEYRKKANRRKA